MKSRALNGFWEHLRGEPIGGRSPTAIWRRCSSSTGLDAVMEASRTVSSSRLNGYWSLLRFSSESSANLRIRTWIRRIRSPISNWPRACPSSCGVAFQTTDYSIWRSRADFVTGGSSSARRGVSSRIPRSTARVVDFLSQWLELRLLSSLVADSKAFPDFDEHLRSALQRELELFLKNQVAEDHGVPEFLTAEYTFVNERLARHYGIPNVYGNEFRRVTITDDARVGLLGKGGILAVTSYPNRTSPVLRGKWVLANLLGSPPPEPPPNVPALKDVGPTGQPASVRERLEQHRNNPVCANCHAQFDPLGLALENFDAIGAWRTEDAGAPINASFVMPGTTPLQGCDWVSVSS